MINAKQELQRVLKNKTPLKCAVISDDKRDIVLKLNYTEADYEKFLNELDFDYDNGFGQQELFGMVWFEDGTWLSRCEYDGSEWWNHYVLPIIPAECL